MASSTLSEPADRSFVRSAMKKPMLSQEHEQDLAIRWRDEQDEAALHELTGAYMRLVISMASKFRHYGLPLADLVQEGSVGLMQAAARFDPDRQVRFSTYASWWIRSSIQDYVLRNWSIVRTGTTAAQKSLFFNLKRLRAKIDDTGDGVMSVENRNWIATHLGVPERDVEAMASRLSASDRSLNAPLATDSEAQWQDLLEDETAVTEERVMESRDGERRKQWIAEALKTLNERENLIIRERRLTDTTVTLEVLGKRLGISKERVRQIEHQALGKLRKALVSIVGDPEDTGLIPVS
ncbi:RNA polymerase factor sigma-32 [Henriciella mobilis]|uniref:RNA polymerase factor sigma-32 n=1 Tax=Henriciella mobilis TaxID=2305467 RepID=A0A399RLI8_9PROT|nr:RNA polymerase factor sigma-32 [Henriciella mobilis]RIJ17560.1 RNA polymerase factor sigma-32 [Henriciella mobilis]RIJ25452.1 RNA polymerase factor sigma-32 [Henriciella mobilis]RIJ30585.1 RNA polymerase factor sigma-32 [Henriciella mobilis]